ncbi:c-type cytochrome biogenesis protein CcmI [Brevundimonas sp. FT23042]|uniref:c-type cytochrome biogenesis protein CcmI n=2 Tax=unclassified Brevundimonas TaxID=2622653 RepID=UPI003B588558
MFFWIMTALLAALSGLLVMTGARRGVDAGEAAETAASATELDELDRLKARGLLEEAAWVAARAEAGRRILAGRRAPVTLRAGAKDRVLVLAGAGVAVAGALGLYLLVGTSGLPDQPYERRIDEWATLSDPLEPVQIAAVIERQVREQPDNPQALAMLGAARFEAGDAIGAASAFRRLLQLTPGDARAWARLGESLVRANGGTIGADAEAAFLEALKLDPGQLGALYFLGEAALARGDAAEVRRRWLPLIAVLDPADPRRTDLERRLPAGGAQ